MKTKHIATNEQPKNTVEYGRASNGRFNKGNQGKPKGAENKVSKNLKSFLTEFLISKSSELDRIWYSLEDKDKAVLYIHLSKLVLPKPVEVNNEIQHFEQPLFPEISIHVERTGDLQTIDKV